MAEKMHYVAVLPDGSEHPFDTDCREGDHRSVKLEQVRRSIHRLLDEAKIYTSWRDPQTIPVKYFVLGILNGAITRNGPYTAHVTPAVSRMTETEFNEEQDKLLETIPVEFHAALSYAAYESGHSSGMEETINELRGLIAIISEPLQTYTTNLTQKLKGTS